MSTVIFDISMSLDGFIEGANPTLAEPLGEGGERLHDWAAAEENLKYMQGALDSLGAVITGRANYDASLPFWGANGPTGPARRPVFVVTHEAPPESPDGGVYEFVTDGIEGALRRARLVAGDKDVTVMGGANIGQQYLAAGVVDEVSIHLVPVLLGDGKRMFENLHGADIRLGTPSVVESKDAVHLRFRVVRESR